MTTFNEVDDVDESDDDECDALSVRFMGKPAIWMDMRLIGDSSIWHAIVNIILAYRWLIAVGL